MPGVSNLLREGRLWLPQHLYAARQMIWELANGRTQVFCYRGTLM
jgi:hypothetical protein